MERQIPKIERKIERYYSFKGKKPKFSPEEAEAIREGHAKGISIRELGRLWKADKNTIWSVIKQRLAYSKYKQV